MIELKNIDIVQGDFELKNISFAIPQGEYAVLMGKTGCGKTTIIEALCGLRSVTNGVIIINGEDVTHLHPSERRIGYVPQDGALFSTMTVRENIAFALAIRSVSKQEINQKVSEIVESLCLTHLLDRGVGKLSGGERQRIALARALVFEPGVLLLDEPLSTLDDETHGEMCGILKKMNEEKKVTVLHVTHNMNEAKGLADCIFKMNQGAIDRIE